jgi:hypothetical protein
MHPLIRNDFLKRLRHDPGIWASGWRWSSTAQQRRAARRSLSFQRHSPQVRDTLTATLPTVHKKFGSISSRISRRFS